MSSLLTKPNVQTAHWSKVKSTLLNYIALTNSLLSSTTNFLQQQK